jgi:hypothetical protein
MAKYTLTTGGDYFFVPPPLMAMTPLIPVDSVWPVYGYPADHTWRFALVPRVGALSSTAPWCPPAITDTRLVVAVGRHTARPAEGRARNRTGASAETALESERGRRR